MTARLLGGSVILVAACHDPAIVPPPHGGVRVTITATVGSTRFVTREHMIASAEMQISGEPLAEAMGRDLGSYSRDRLPTDLYFEPELNASWIDLAGFSTGVESYEYSKQPMNMLAFESGAGTSLAFAPLLGDSPALIDFVQRSGQRSNALGRFVFPAGTWPVNNPSGNVNPTGAGTGAANPLGWPGMLPTLHVFASFDPAIAPGGAIALACALSSDDNPSEGNGGAPVVTGDYECDASTLHLRDRAAQIDPIITPGADGFTSWKYGLWAINYLQIMHDSTEAPVASVAEAELGDVGAVGNQVIGDDGGGTATEPGTYLGSSDVEGFQAQLLLAMLDNRAADWLLHLATSDGATLAGFATLADALAYDHLAPLRWFPSAVRVTEDVTGRPSFAVEAADSQLLDLAGIVLGFATVYAMTDGVNAGVGGAQTARAFYDGDPFALDDGVADAEGTTHDRALAMLRVALVDIDRMHRAPDGVLVERSAGHELSTTTLAYTLLALRTALRSLDGQLQLYSNTTPDTAITRTPLDAFPLNAPDGVTFGVRMRQLLRQHAELLLDRLTTPDGAAFAGWDTQAAAPSGGTDSLDAHAAAIRGLFTAYLATGDTRYRDRARAVFDRMQAVFYDPDARIFTATPAPVDEVEYTPLRFGLVQSALRDMYELVAVRPGNEALAVLIEDQLARLNKLVLNGWDDRNFDRLVAWPDECVNVQDGLPRGGLQMAERALTGEIGSQKEQPLPGEPRIATADREHDCVPEVDDARLPAALAGSVTFHIAREPL